MNKKRFLCFSPTFVTAPSGARSVEESTVHCTRCNACVQSCPSYLSRHEEAYSPRGRNQIIRLLAERKIKFSDNETLLYDVCRSCLFCARCTAACAGVLPMAEHVLALRRAAEWDFLPASLKILLRLHGTHPTLFDMLLCVLRLFRRAGLLHLLRISGLLSLPPLYWLKHADDILPRRLLPLPSALKKHKINPCPEKPDILYLPSFEAQYLDAQQGLASLQRLADKHPLILTRTPSGLFEYVYGNLSLCMSQAKRLLSRWHALSGKRPLPVITDSIEIFVFLKHFPVLFAGHPAWRKRAEGFAAKVQFITQVVSARKTAAKTAGETVRCALDDSSLLYTADEPVLQSRKILKTLFGKNFVECEYSRFVIPAGGTAFVRGPERQNAVLENVKDVARRQIEQVYCLSGLAAWELDAALRRHYPQACARHIVHIQAKPWQNSRQTHPLYPPTRN